MRALVCGGRDFSNREYVYGVLDALTLVYKIKWVIQGGARGADTLAREWAVDRRVKKKTYKADWNAYGRSAGHIRNALMLKEGKPDLVIAFPGGKGTADMISQSIKAGLTVLVLQSENFESSK